MTRHKADRMAFLNKEGLRGYEAVWRHILWLSEKNDSFSCKDIEMLMNAPKNTVYDHVKRYLKAGYIENHGVINELMHYKLVKKRSEAPKLNRMGQEVSSGRGNDNMWRTMKMLGRFNKIMLSVQSTTKETKVSINTAETYIHHLVKAGYLHCVKQSIPGTAAEYVFLRDKNTGFKAPQIMRDKSVFDRNLGRVVYKPEPRSAQ